MSSDAPLTTDQIDLARRVAKIAGPASAAAEAVRRCEELRVLGFPAMIYRVGPLWLVSEPG